MTDKEWVEGAAAAFEWVRPYALKNPDRPRGKRRWGVWADNEYGWPMLVGEGSSEAKAWQAAKAALGAKMSLDIARALRLKAFLDRVATGW